MNFSLKRKQTEPAPLKKVAKGFADDHSFTTKSTDEVIMIKDVSDINAKPSSSSKAPLVIPLMVTNEWRLPEGTTTLAPTSTSAEASLSDQGSAPTLTKGTSTLTNPPTAAPTDPLATSEASAEEVKTEKPARKWGLQLMNKSSTSGEGDLRTTTAESAPNIARRTNPVPLIQRNAIPGLEQIADPKEKYMYDISVRPDSASQNDYDNISIEDFGAAMMRGMGWKDEDKEAEVVFHKPRPNLLGLGAKLPSKAPKKLNEKEKEKEKSSSSSSNGVKSSSESSLPNDKSRDKGSSGSSSRLREGAKVEIMKKGRHYGKIGYVTSVKDKGSDGIAIKVDIKGDDIVRCWSDEVDIIR
ncbi:hypothetical protein HDU76_004850 [Blyttiomyces sp. JEL0837]|nr:hypothetical protein HDU76_004850 [Blyttiomyces sp. JEL0837]